ncbi:MAG TPA: hypothetical protein VHL11_16845 [Phototrophicaceae bacterium]|jgi:hypothetical protein|nr:hypothetical protein [Phototrophicaceae bacterium]
MKTHTALEIAAHTAALVQLCAAFQAQYGRYCTLKPGSSPEAWSLYNEITNRQIAIGQLLDEKAVETPNNSFARWWEHQDVMDLSNAKTLMQQVSHLIATCAYFEAETHETDWSYAIYCAESTIAGLIHPAALQVALSSFQVKSERYAG